MFQTRLLRRNLALCVLASALVASGYSLTAAAPTAPSNLTAAVNGQVVTLNWTASANSPTQYRLEAGFAPGQTALSVSLSASTTSFTASAGPGTYYVRVYAVNADGTSAASNEVTVLITSSCTPPSVPRNLRAMMRGTEIYLFWTLPAIGAPTGYSIQAGVAPGQTIAQFNTTGRTMNTAVPGGTYYARVIAMSECGNSPATPDLPVTFPSNSVRVPDPEPGSVLGLPDIYNLVARLARENPPTLANSCPTGRKYELNPWLNYIVDQLRTYDTRFGYNAKPTKSSVDNGGYPVVVAGDEIAYFRGSGTAQGSGEVYAIDILQGSCSESMMPTFRDIYPEPAIWTGAGRFTGDQ